MFKIWILSCHHYPANIYTIGFVKKICRSSAMVTELEVTCIFRANLREIGCGKLGVKPTAPNGLAQL